MADAVKAPVAQMSETQGTPTPGDEGEHLLTLLRANSGAEEEEPAEEPAETPADEESGDAKEEAVVTEGDEEPATEEEPASTDVLYTVVVDGKEEQVKLDELLAGYSRTGDYTRKTMAVAEQRKAVESEATQMRADRERYVQGLREVETLLTASATEPDWTKLADELEPAEYNKARAQWDTRTQRVNALRTQREDLERKAQAEFLVQQARQIEAEQVRLYAAIPEWKDRAKAETEQREIVDYALKAGEAFGVTPEAIGQITTAFPLLVLRKAMLYDRMLAAKPKVVAQKVPTPTAKPGAKTVQTNKSPAELAFAKLQTTGDSQAAEDYILARLTGK